MNHSVEEPGATAVHPKPCVWGVVTQDSVFTSSPHYFFQALNHKLLESIVNNLYPFITRCLTPFGGDEEKHLSLLLTRPWMETMSAAVRAKIYDCRSCHYGASI